ncbi:MAG TPA: DegQ family serine endoprotease [Alteromonas australica]|nr:MULTISPECIES: DegQ family serine endoprotease [Alteromonas]MAB92343.1 serine endoprotease DegQ [Alteromonas sp.]MBU34921.1 serine endoprotease DegQ [Alteromonas sp.]QPL52066.1 DegQ family serine endoprotease [Alteromonas sp. B31-7]HAI71804.1 DegQ family serine endoprotease [Alteromonas australica]HAW77728.1 DegQ family serine endoprotease [Alteromonas australica]
MSFRHYVLASAVVVSSMGFSVTANAALPFFSDKKDEVPSLAPMLEEATPAVVSIAVKGTQTSRQQVPEMFQYFFGAPQEQVQERPFRGLGSGVIIDAEKGYVVTNSHVVDNADEITVKLTDGREFTAKKLGADEQSDIALLKIDPDDLKAIPLADSDELRVGDFVVAIGNPFGLSQTVTSGIVSALGRSGLNIGGYEDFIQTDAAINRGNSGGALVDLHGRLVGINTAIFGPNGGNVGIGFAIPSNMMKSLADQIAEYGEVRRGLLGIVGSDIDAGLAEAMNANVNIGAFVSEVTPESAAEDAGIEAGDIITEVNGRKINSFLELRARISSMGAGAEVELTLLRKGEEVTVEVVLGDATQATVTAQQIHPALEGATLTNGADEAGNAGVVISDIERNSPAARIGLKPDDVIVGVNRKRTSSVSDFRNALDDASGVIALNVKRGNSTLYLVIR